jgi:transposase-like protein
MVRPDQDRIEYGLVNLVAMGGRAKEHVEVDESWIGGRTRGEGRGVHHKVLVACAVEVRHRKPGTAQDKRRDGRYAGRVRLAVVSDRSGQSLGGFIDGAVVPGTLIVTDDWSGYAGLRKRGYDHHAIAECGDPEVADEFLPIIHLVFANLKTWLIGIHHGVSAQHLQAYLNEFTFRFNRRFTRSMPFALCSALRVGYERRPMTSFPPAIGSTLHVAAVCLNRIGKQRTYRLTDWRSLRPL